MRTHLFPVRSVLLLILLGGSTYAHHGVGAWYDTTRSVTVKGTVTSFEWTNPHSYIYVDAKDANGTITKWSAEMGGLPMLSRHGWRRDTIKPGDEITLIGKPSRDGKPAMLLDKGVLGNGQELPASDLVAGTAVGPGRETKQ